MKKIQSFLFAIFVVMIAISCKSAPTVAESKPEPVIPSENRAFTDAYEMALPFILDNAEHHVVKAGETLTQIARSKYGRGNAFFFPLIMAASKAQNTVDIVDPDKIEPGMELIIPNLAANRNDPEICARIKVLLLHVSQIYKNRPETRWSSELVDGLVTTANDL
jgi:hypothetical protein